MSASLTTRPPWLDVKALTSTGPDTTGGYLVAPEHSGSFIDALRPLSALLDSGVRVIRTSAQALDLPRVTGDPTATWRDEVESLSGTSDESFGLVHAVPKKLCAYTTISRELFEDSTPDVVALLEHQLAKRFALALDEAAFKGATVNAGLAPVPLGQIAGIQIRDSRPNGGIDMLDTITTSQFYWFAAALQRYLASHGNLNTAALFMHPRLWAVFHAIKDSGSVVPALSNLLDYTTGRTRLSLFGVRVFLSSHIPVDDSPTGGPFLPGDDRYGNLTQVYLVDTSQLAVVIRQDLRVEVDRSRHFDQDAIGLRATMRADLVSFDPATINHTRGLYVPSDFVTDGEDA